MLETPLVIFLSQRPAPATGMPTWTEQGDLLFAVNAGHGDFPKIVLAPGDAEEMYKLTVKAFDLADIYQTPVIVLSDKYLSESHQSVLEETFSKLAQNYKPNRGKIVSQVDGQKYQRYQVTDDGISPMLIPGAKGIFYQSNSYEHLENGHTTEEASERLKQADKRFRKLQTYLKKDFQKPEVYGDFDKSEIVFVSWGGNKGPILEAMKELDNASLINFTHLFPLDPEILIPLFPAGKRYVLVENNQTGQFGRLLRGETGIEIKEKLLKYDGRSFWSEEIIEYAKHPRI
jgi:2-oxoglutarate ferredoxin oxidoreductase subunit alpha